jgi:hypothetical protein
MRLKARSLAIGLVALMAIGIFASTALAEPGPWWHHRKSSSEGNGLKIEKQAPETFSGEGTKTELIAKLGSGHTEFKIKCNIKTKGEIWNEPKQGQGKVVAEYEKCVANSIEGCNVTVAAPGPYQLFIVWKYAGNAKELENLPQLLQGQIPDFLLLPPGVTMKTNGTEIEPSEKASFAKVLFAATKCGAIAGLSGKAEGGTGFTSSVEAEHFGKTATLTFPGGILKQHAWWQKPEGSDFLPIRAELFFNNEEAKFSGTLPIEFSQEVGVFES